ncbi:unnamed protein product [Colias eurytheme]|nr:unnamed protein product [Colias eurytheme]
MYREEYPNARPTNVRTVVNANQRLLDYGSFHAPSHSTGRGRPAWSQNVYDDVLAYFEEDPRRSTKDAARRFNISQSCAWNIVNKAGLHPYHFRKSQELTAVDHGPRISFCNWILNNTEENMLFSDECLFTRVGLFNQHNEHLWWSIRIGRLEYSQQGWITSVSL